MLKRTLKNAIGAGIISVFLIAVLLECMEIGGLVDDKNNLKSTGSLQRSLRPLLNNVNEYSKPQYSNRNAPESVHTEGSMWPPRSIVDNIVDSRNRVIVISVNCGFIGKQHFIKLIYSEKKWINLTSYV